MSLERLLTYLNQLKSLSPDRRRMQGLASRQHHAKGETMRARGMLILAGSIALALAICLSMPASAADDSFSRVKGAGELVIGSTVTGVPTTFMDPKTGEMQGTMIDVAKYIAGKLGVKLRIVETPWASLMPSLMCWLTY